MPTKQQLKDLQKASLFEKIILTKQRIREWVSHFGEDGVYVSFSGGKDSTVLLHLVREDFPDVEAVFVNTGLEYPEIQRFVKSFDNVTILRPKISFLEVIKKYGYPLVSKSVSHAIRFARKGSKWAVNAMNGLHSITGDKNNYNEDRYGIYNSLLNVDFLISDACCGVMKESPLNTYTKKSQKNPFIALLTEESTRREKAWLKSGCNAFDSDKPSSKPMSFWTEQDVLQYISQNNIPIASVYGDIVYKARDGNTYDNLLCDTGNCTLCTTGCERTG